VIVALWIVAGCSTAAPECIDAGDCRTGEACIAGTCQQVGCLTSADCDVRQYCEVGLQVCLDGCRVDDDCLAGETCDPRERRCEVYGCRDTQLDCYYNEVCDPATGWCETSDEAHCKPCNNDNVCGDGACFDFGKPETYCLVACNPNQPDTCPRGYDCADATGLNDFYCIGWCPLYDEFGYLPW
jgi:hypothetical protein